MFSIPDLKTDIRQLVGVRRFLSFWVVGVLSLPFVFKTSLSQVFWLQVLFLSFFLHNRNTKPHSQYYLFIVGLVLLWVAVFSIHCSC